MQTKTPSKSTTNSETTSAKRRVNARRRLVLVYNPRSSGFKTVQSEVIAPLRQKRNLSLLKFTVEPTNVDANATKLARVLEDDDLVLVAGGDGTATIALNGVMLARKTVRLAVLGYGNFNDFARTLGGYDFAYVEKQLFRKAAPVTTLYPLDIRVNGKHWRYAASYLTLGLFAESTQVFDEPEVRHFLQKHGKNLVFSVAMLARWYFRNRRREFVANGRINGQKLPAGTTDVMAVNSKSVAKVMRGGNLSGEPTAFWLSTARLGSFWRLVKFMASSILHRLPGASVETLRLEFDHASSVELQAEGEYQKLTGVKTIEIAKSSGVECLVK